MKEKEPFVELLHQAIEEQEKSPTDPNEPGNGDWPEAEKPVEKPKPKAPNSEHLDLSA